MKTKLRMCCLWSVTSMVEKDAIYSFFQSLLNWSQFSSRIYSQSARSLAITHMHCILGSLFCFFILFSSKLYMYCLLKTATVTLSMFSPWFSMWEEVFQGKETAQEEMLTFISYDQNSLLPIAFSSFAVFWFLFFWFSFFAVRRLLSSFHFFVDLCSLLLASFSVLFNIVFPLFLFCPLSLQISSSVDETSVPQTSLKRYPLLASMETQESQE